MNALTLEVILRVVFGVTDEARLAELRPCVNRTVNISPAVLLGWGYPALQRFGPWKRTVDNAYRARRADLRRDPRASHAPDLAERTDVLSAADPCAEGDDGDDRLTDEELRDQLVTLLLAGHETTATALAWALHELGRDRAPARSARAGRRTTGDDDYLEAVLKESMRLHPVIPMVVRTLMQPATIGGWDLPAGATVGPSILISAQPAPTTIPTPSGSTRRGSSGSNPPVEHLDPVRRRRPPLHRRRVLADGGRGRAARDPHGVRRRPRVGADRPKVRNITSVPAAGRADPGGLSHDLAEFRRCDRCTPVRAGHNDWIWFGGHVCARSAWTWVRSGSIVTSGCS